jgi:hypothetical protein
MDISQISKGSTLGNRINCQYTYWHLNNNLIPGTQASIIDPDGYQPDSSKNTVIAQILIVHETKDKNGNSIIAVLVDTWSGSRLAKVYVYYWLSDQVDDERFSPVTVDDKRFSPVTVDDERFSPDLWKKCFNSEEDISQFINEVEEKLAQLMLNKTIVMSNNEQLYKFY